ncbi:hypothetical protein ACFYXC_01730 [Streptomyces sp. NPDC002701]|uniref:hypothetical protein n=1 Tax=Streptomyces sp. NPDC002701 TaxID=3364661 RepID=UPI0036CC4EBE
MRMKSCSTCKSQRQPHRFLEPKEAVWVKEHLKEKFTGTYMICLAPLDDGAKQCRNLRTSWAEKHLKEPLRLPEQE